MRRYTYTFTFPDYGIITLLAVKTIIVACYLAL